MSLRQRNTEGLFEPPSEIHKVNGNQKKKESFPLQQILSELSCLF